MEIFFLRIISICVFLFLVALPRRRACPATQCVVYCATTAIEIPAAPSRSGCGVRAASLSVCGGGVGTAVRLSAVYAEAVGSTACTARAAACSKPALTLHRSAKNYAYNVRRCTHRLSRRSCGSPDKTRGRSQRRRGAVPSELSEHEIRAGWRRSQRVVGFRPERFGAGEFVFPCCRFSGVRYPSLRRCRRHATNQRGPAGARIELAERPSQAR